MSTVKGCLFVFNTGVCYHPFWCSKALIAPSFSAMLQSVGVTRFR